MDSKSIQDASEEILVCEDFTHHKEFLEKLKNNKDITKIQYKSNSSSIRNPDLIDFGDLVEKCQRLSDFCFNLSYTHELTNDGPIYLLNAVSKINSVKKLSVSITASNGVKEPALIELARLLPSMPQLESLDVKLGHCGFPSGDAFLYYLNKALPKLTCLKEFAFSIVDKSTIDDMDLVELSQALQHTKALKSLRLKLRGERINGFNKFAENISSMQSLETLGFDIYELENPYGYVTVEQLNFFFDIPTKLNHLKTFEIRLPYAINPKGIKTADIQNMKSLENINLNARMFDAEALEGISLALSKLPKIKNVDLLIQSEPNTSVEGFGKHAQNWPVFENFKICLQSIDPKGLQDFVKVLKVNDSVNITFYPQYEAPIDSELFKSFGNITFMKRFCTSGLSLNEAEFAMFIEGVKNMKSLKSFYHQNDRVSYLKTHLRDYGEALKTLPALESISLNITHSEITDKGIIDLLTELEEVNELKEFNITLYYCYEGRGDFIAKFIEWIGKHKKLEKVVLNLDVEEGTQTISDDDFDKMKSELEKSYPQIKFTLNNVWHEIH